ncbi:MAG: tetratricopeptide repeat protein, partial [Methanoregulaceae archaeon]|nr:tetratricopeptide repeat protein [Methanoregulaceae archaeon]
RALGFAEQALKLKPDNPAIMDTAGWILVQQGQAERGAKLLQQALSKMPNAAEIRYHLAVAYTKLGDDARAEKELQSVLATNAAFHQRQKAKTLLAQLQAKTR